VYESAFDQRRVEEVEAEEGGRERGREGGQAIAQWNVLDAAAEEAAVNEGREGGGEEKEVTMLVPMDMPSLEDLDKYLFGDREGELG